MKPCPRTLFACLVAVGLLAGCASSPPAPSGDTRQGPESSRIVQALHAQHEDWAGTPYRLGGASRRGIDCSAFVQTTFRQHFDQSLPRSTARQATLGRQVARSDMRPGDLVFFRTGGKTRHVGIYVDDGRFLHASTSQGVTFSHLDNPYWRDAWWMARRP